VLSCWRACITAGVTQASSLHASDSAAHQLSLRIHSARPPVLALRIAGPP
jgi:hypothetical protein